jgi:hypothetical protein
MAPLTLSIRVPKLVEFSYQLPEKFISFRVDFADFSNKTILHVLDVMVSRPSTDSTFLSVRSPTDSTKMPTAFIGSTSTPIG